MVVYKAKTNIRNNIGTLAGRIVWNGQHLESICSLLYKHDDANIEEKRKRKHKRGSKQMGLPTIWTFTTEIQIYPSVVL